MKCQVENACYEHFSPIAREEVAERTAEGLIADNDGVRALLATATEVWIVGLPSTFWVWPLRVAIRVADVGGCRGIQLDCNGARTVLAVEVGLEDVDLGAHLDVVEPAHD